MVWAEWEEAIENDPYWQFEELIEEDLELAEYLWDCQRIATLSGNRLGIEIPMETFFALTLPELKIGGQDGRIEGTDSREDKKNAHNTTFNQGEFNN